jgi:hypothetical protein
VELGVYAGVAHLLSMNKTLSSIPRTAKKKKKEEEEEKEKEKFYNILERRSWLWR